MAGALSPLNVTKHLQTTHIRFVKQRCDQVLTTSPRAQVDHTARGWVKLQCQRQTAGTPDHDGSLNEEEVRLRHRQPAGGDDKKDVALVWQPGGSKREGRRRQQRQWRWVLRSGAGVCAEDNSLECCLECTHCWSESSGGGTRKCASVLRARVRVRCLWLLVYIYIYKYEYRWVQENSVCMCVLVCVCVCVRVSCSCVYACLCGHVCAYVSLCAFFLSCLPPFFYSFLLSLFKKLNFNIHLHFKLMSCLAGFFFSLSCILVTFLWLCLRYRLFAGVYFLK